MNISLCEHKSGEMLQAVKQSLTWIPGDFWSSVSGFGQFFIVSAHICIAPSQNLNVFI